MLLHLFLTVIIFQLLPLIISGFAVVRATAMTDVDLRTQADELYEQMKYDQIVELLEPKKVGLLHKCESLYFIRCSRCVCVS